MLVTIDSNIYNLAQLVAEKLPEPATRWCSKLNQCLDNFGSTNKLVYNTPVSMSSDVTYYNLPDSAIHFVYLDFGRYQTDLKRILKNIRQLKNVIVLSNGGVYPTGQYVLNIGNCTDDDVAEVISGIIILHLELDQLIPEQAIISLLRGIDYIPSEEDTSDQKIYNVYNILESKRSSCGEISDCYECQN